MTSHLVVSGALANCGADSRIEDFLDLQAGAIPEVEIFRRTGPERRTIVASAFDWQAVVGTGADLIAYGTLLWTAYEKLVKPKLKRHKDGPRPFLFITIRGSSSQAQFQIGEKYQSESEFVDEFVARVSEMRCADGQSAQPGPDIGSEWVRYRKRDVHS